MVEHGSGGGNILGDDEWPRKVHVPFMREDTLTFHKSLSHNVGRRIMPGLNGIGSGWC